MITIGQKVMTPNGPGEVAVFECSPPLSTRLEAYFDTKYPEDHEDGWFIRVGVTGTSHQLETAFYPLSLVKPV